ncbi:ChrR family anti-sigma-E factor [Chelatococcus sambhunathii]|uniref:ChrR family anti-sigma-E factor n=1 Tax=Chelatococcus sambhunathii TaxID=363953 RepID=UPI002852C8B4|nr:ChrR family anti-sigma-E factor [Chelatococcus sambhunathii]
MSAPPKTTQPVGAPRRIERLLDGYARGALDPYSHALVEAHLILSPENRDYVRNIEATIGEELEAVPSTRPQRAARDQVLAAIYAGGWYGRPRPPKIDPDLPEPLARLVGAPLSDLKWRFAAPGAREHRVFEGGGISASFIQVKPSRRLPQHTHCGIEATLVIKGAFSDHLGRYRRGDVAVADPSVDHSPIADPDGPCVCFVVAEGPPRLTGPLGRLLQRVFGG